MSQKKSVGSTYARDTAICNIAECFIELDFQKYWFKTHGWWCLSFCDVAHLKISICGLYQILCKLVCMCCYGYRQSVGMSLAITVFRLL